MIVLNKPAMTHLARALRAELAPLGITVGHQTALNLAIEAVGYGSPHATLALLDRGAIILDHTEWRIFIEHALLIAPTEPQRVMERGMLQFARLCAHEHALRFPGARPEPPAGEGQLVRLPEGGLTAMIAASATVCDLRKVIDGQEIRLRLPLKPGSAEGNAETYLLEPMEADAPAYPVVDLQDPAGRLSMALDRLGKAPAMSDPVLQLGAALLKALTTVEEMEDSRALLAWRLQALNMTSNASLHSGVDWLWFMGSRVISTQLRWGGLHLRLSDGSLQSPGMLCEDGVLRERIYPTPQPTTEEASGLRFCMADLGGERRVGLHLFTETRDGTEFHTFDFGEDPEHADLIEGEFRWLSGQGHRNAVDRHRLREMLGKPELEAWHQEIETVLATGMVEIGTEPPVFMLLQRAIDAQMDHQQAPGRRL